MYIFGYFEDTKAYKLYDPITRKVIIRCDIQFMDNEEYDGSTTKTTIIIVEMEHDDTKDEVVLAPTTGQCVVPSKPSTRTKNTSQNTPIRSISA
jgi:hypothetical protein